MLGMEIAQQSGQFFPVTALKLKVPVISGTWEEIFICFGLL